MVTKCPTNINQSLVSLCENNPITGNVDDIIPVTDLVSNTHYKNLHCARCNGKDDTNIMATWSLKIHNDVFIKFPEKDLLAKIRSREGNIFLVPPDYVMVEACFLPPYTISRCNVSGLWSSYDQYIVQSCNLFVDPFNSTYQNAFCYLCNIPTYNISEPINTCIDPFLMDVAYDEPKAQFQALVDVVTVTQQADDESRIDKSNLACDRTKFKDEIQVNI